MHKDKDEKVMIPQHSHGIVCGKPIAPTKVTCSRECEEKLMKMERDRRYNTLVPLIILFGAVAILVIRSLFGL